MKEIEKIKNIKNSVIIQNITKDSIPYIISNIFDNSEYKFIAYIVENNFELELIKNEIKFYSNNIKIIEFPEWNTIPYDINSPQIKIQIQRMKSLYNLINYDKMYKNEKVLLLISKKAILQKIINKKEYKYIQLYEGQKISLKDIKNILNENCYSMTDTAINTGDYSINNNDIDIITFNSQSYRIILYNNSIKEIKSFNPKTQISSNNFKEILILPIKEVIFNNKNIKNFKMNYMNYFDAQNIDDKLYQNISNNIFYNGCENWMPLFYENELQSIFDYLPNNVVFSFANETIINIDTYQKIIENYYKNRCNELKIKNINDNQIYNPINPELLYINSKILANKIKEYKNIIFDLQNIMQEKNIIKLNFTKIPNFFKESEESFKDLKNFLNKN